MKNLPAIILLFIANSISGCAQGISMIAIPWYFTQIDGMEKFGWAYVMINFVSLIWVPYTGTIIDRYNRKYIFLGITVFSGLVLFSIASLGYYWGALPWYMVAGVFGMTFLNYNIHYPNLYAFVQEISEQKYYGNITSYIEIQGQITSMLAGAGAALLLEGSKHGTLNVFGFKVAVPFDIAAWQIHEIFFMDACTYLVSFFIIIMIQFTPLVQREKETGSAFSQLKIGFDYLMEHRMIFLFGIASYAIFVAVLIEGFYTGAKYVSAHLQETGDVYAASEMYYALGAIFAGVAIHKVFGKMTIPMSIILMTFMTAILYMVLAVTNSVLIFYVMLFILGITNAGTRIQRVTYFFKHIPNQVYGRASSIFFLSNIIIRTMFLSLFAMPFFHEGNNIVYTFMMLGVFIFGAGVVLAVYYRRFVGEELEGH